MLADKLDSEFSSTLISVPTSAAKIPYQLGPNVHLRCFLSFSLPLHSTAAHLAIFFPRMAKEYPTLSCPNAP